MGIVGCGKDQRGEVTRECDAKLFHCVTNIFLHHVLT